MVTSSASSATLRLRDLPRRSLLFGIGDGPVPHVAAGEPVKPTLVPDTVDRMARDGNPSAASCTSDRVEAAPGVVSLHAMSAPRAGGDFVLPNGHGNRLWS